MHLMYYLNEDGNRVYTLKKTGPDGRPTVSAHPARFSPDDKYSKHRILCKQRFGLLPTQQPAPELEQERSGAGSGSLELLVHGAVWRGRRCVSAAWPGFRRGGCGSLLRPCGRTRLPALLSWQADGPKHPLIRHVKRCHPSMLQLVGHHPVQRQAHVPPMAPHSHLRGEPWAQQLHVLQLGPVPE
eukprot:CAMPEP_0196772506 /NCGR_PEP_ID=MMETSP1104-20130614/2267_1 /TAXON_ID=33652 /ORGANISM="Cafeteria sp., Strain Caron Lab Isolate" /LENGTH=184 /DNA_ID=CAMNT_0042142641 /DNA_START=33 /DNA_END=588 /DNA_ORIENTATION=+